MQALWWLLSLVPVATAFSSSEHRQSSLGYTRTSSTRLAPLSASTTTSKDPSVQQTLRRADDLCRCLRYRRRSGSRLVLSGMGGSSSTGIGGNYGRGAEIWPPTNEEPVQLSDSFPWNQIPDNIQYLLDQINGTTETTPAASDPSSVQQQQQQKEVAGQASQSIWNRILPFRQIFSRTHSYDQGAFSKFLQQKRQQKRRTALRVLLYAGGMASLVVYTKPLDWIVGCFMTGYLLLLLIGAQSVRSDGITPYVPALPPTGHWPTWVTNPLRILPPHLERQRNKNRNNSNRMQDMLDMPGMREATIKEKTLQQRVASVTSNMLMLVQSAFFQQRLAVVLGWIAPAVAVVAYTLQQSSPELARACARPLFIVFCQALTELVLATRQQHRTPLPIRIFAPVAYTSIRLGYVWNWLLTVETTTALAKTSSSTFVATIASLGTLAGWRDTVVSQLGRCLAWLNLVYVVLYLFAYLLPVAVMRYMRAHFFCVEAEQVITRAGLEETLFPF